MMTAESSELRAYLVIFVDQQAELLHFLVLLWREHIPDLVFETPVPKHASGCPVFLLESACEKS